jgi:hypothetical protein
MRISELGVLNFIAANSRKRQKLMEELEEENLKLDNRRLRMEI